MNFIKKHYEKIILAFFLLIFIFSLGWAIIVLKKSTNIQIEDCRLPKIPANYPKADMKLYDISLNFENDKDWVSLVPEKTDEKISYMDFMIPYPAERCPHCGKIIPSSAFFAEKCPVCSAKLDKPGAEKVMDENLDRDGDGIPDETEKKLGLNPNDPSDIYLDNDKDGFNNLAEYYLKTDMNDINSHPDVTSRLFVKEISLKPIDFVVKKISRIGGDDKTKWQIQASAKLKGKKKMDDDFFKIGDKLEFNKDTYSIVDIISKTVKKIDTRLKAELEEDASEVIIQKDGDTPITAKLNTPVYETKENIKLGDISSGKDYQAVSGSTFTVIMAGDETYNFTVLKTDPKNMTVILKNTKTGTETEIGKTPAISKYLNENQSSPVNPSPSSQNEKVIP